MIDDNSNMIDDNNSNMIDDNSNNMIDDNSNNMIDDNNNMINVYVTWQLTTNNSSDNNASFKITY